MRPSSPAARRISQGAQEAKDQIIENVDNLRQIFGDSSPRRNSMIKGHTLKRLTMGGANIDNLEVILADESLAYGRARCRRPYAELHSEWPNPPQDVTRTELLAYNELHAKYEKKVCFVKKLPFVAEIHDLAGLGIGFELYAWQACTLAVVLTLMGLTSLPNLLWNVSAAYAHFGDAAYTAYPLTSVSLGMRSEPFSILQPGLLELLTSAIFAGYLLWLRWWNTTVARVNNRMHTTSADYTVEVSKLPVSVTEEQLRDFFARELDCDATTEVVAVELPTQDTVELAEESAKFAATWRDALEAKARIEEAAKPKPLSALTAGKLWAGLSRLPGLGWDRLDYDALRRQLKEQHSRVSKEYNDEKRGGQDSCGTAFVTFASSELAQRAVRRSRGALEMIALGLWKRARPGYQLPGTPGASSTVPAVHRASEASDVKWENLRYQMWWKGWYPVAMQIATNLLLLLLLLPVCGVVFAMTRYKLILAGEIVRDNGEGDPWLVGLLLDGLFPLLAFFGEWQVRTVTLLISAFISGTNYLLRALMYKLAEYERSSTSTEQQMRLFTLATIVYITSYVNLYYVYTSISEDKADGPDAASQVLLASRSAVHAALHADQIHFDADRFEQLAVGAIDSSHWYGPSGLIPQVLVTALTDGAMLILNEAAIFAPFMLVRRLVGSVQVSQGRMDHYYDPPQFEVAKRYTYLVSNAALVILYGPASPLLYFIGAGSLAMMLLVQKLLLTHCYRRPRVIDDAVAERSREMLSVLLLLHVISSAMFYLVAAKDSNSAQTALQAWPFYLGGLLYLLYATFPFQSLVKRTRDLEDSGTAGKRWKEVEARMHKYRCVYQYDAQLYDRVTDKLKGGAPLTAASEADRLPGYLTGFFSAVCPCGAAAKEPRITAMV